MIEELRISSLGVIEESVLELGPGLSVITGETGAGKTMLVTALGLLLGARADSGAVRSGAGKARVDGVVRVEESLVEAVDELGGEVETDGCGSTVLLGRQVSAEGRSRAFVGGAAVPVSALSALSDRLVAVHGQSDQHRLLRAEAQREALDRFAGTELSTVLEDYVRCYHRLRQVEIELHEVRDGARERAREADLLRLGLAEIERVEPKPGEDADLAAEESRLGHADTLLTAAATAHGLLSFEEGPDAAGAVAAARQALESVRGLDDRAGELSDRVAELGYLLDDLAGDLASYADSVETDPARLAQVSERRAALTSLTRKYGETLAEVLGWAERAAERLLALDGSPERIESLSASSTRLRAELGGLAERLTDLRRAAATRLEKAVTAQLQALSMPQARLQVTVQGAGKFTSTGADEIGFWLAANSGLEPRPLHKGASGGELSRVMLALEVVLADSRAVPTLVFDEVDAGVGGKAAVEVGRRLAALARTAQVLVVTHLPQVAAFADRHVVVRKHSDGSVTTAGLGVLDEAGRVQELSRMLAGLEDSETAMAHAAELLDVARASGAGGGVPAC